MANVRQYIGARYVTKIYENSLDPSSAEWEASTAYEPLTMVTYNNSSYLSKKDVPASVGDPASNPTYWVVTGAYNGQIAHLQDQIDDLDAEIKTGFITPEMFGAAGDGVTNDTAAVQAALDANGTTVVLNGEYRIEDTLCVSGHKNIIGSGTIYAYLPGSAPDEYIFAFGCTTLGVTGAPYTGIIEGIKIALITGNISYGLGFGNAKDTVIRNIIMDFSAGNCHNKFIFFGHNIDIASPVSSKKNFIIEGSLFISDADPNSGRNVCETISFANGHSHITVKDNIILNCKDDGVAVHNCKDISIINNYLYSFSGRIFGSWSQDIVIDGNTIEVEPNIFCQGIQIDYEPGGNNTVNDNIRIVNNIIDYTGTTDSNYQYGIRVRGIKNSLISGNRLISTTGYQGRLFVENHPVTAYTPSLIFSENNEICNNDVVDIVFGLSTAAYNDPHVPNIFHDNKIHRRYVKAGIYNYSRNNAVLCDIDPFDINTLDYALSDSGTLPTLDFVFHGTLSNTAMPMLINGFPTFRIPSDAKLAKSFILRLWYTISLSGSDYYTIKLYKNSSLIATINKQAESIDFASITDADTLLHENDVIYATVQITGTVPSPAPDYVKLSMFINYLNNC